MIFLSLLSKYRIGRRNGSKSYTNSSNTELQLRHFILSMLMWVKLCAFHGRLTAQKSSLRKEASLSNWSVGSPHRQSKLKSGRDPRNAVFIFVFQSGTLHIFCWTLNYFVVYPPGGGDSHLKQTGMLVVSLRGVNFRFWSRLGCSGQSANILSLQGLV